MRPVCATGFSLVEVLIAIVVLALGIVGGAAMQLTALQTRHQSLLLSQAMHMAAGMADSMRANAPAMRAAGGANPYLGWRYDALADPDPAPPSPLCLGAGACASAELAEFDLYELKRQVSEALPAGRAVICRDSNPFQGGHLRWQCQGDAAAPVVIKVGWRAKNPDGRPLLDDDGDFAPGVALPVGALQ
ncbi:type IV pilus modification protein PilV [Oxalobacteraceae bacterium]|nr:type IV pilus modification protein PilV [Oxalobacteraceae bacterium]